VNWTVVNSTGNKFVVGVKINATVKVTPNLRRCPPEKNSHMGYFQGSPHKLYISIEGS